MKTILKFLLCFSLLIFANSCNKRNGDSPNFYNDEYRIGQWITPDDRDTLEFVDSSHFIRRGYIVNEEYLYRIDANILYVRLPDFPGETEHRIEAEHNLVTLSNMYPTFGFGDNSGTFIKSNK